MFWALEQMVWWTLITSLIAGLLIIAWDSPTGQWVRRNARFPLADFAIARSPSHNNEQI
jgi:hypothetical protein